MTGIDNLVDAIVAVITRHPMTEEELVHILDRWQPGHVKESLADLHQSGKAQVVTRGTHRFWSCAEARYIEENRGRCQEVRSGGNTP